MAAVLAAFGQATVYDDSFIGDDKSAAVWHSTSQEMRDAAAQLRAAIEGRDEAAAKSAVERLTKACDACHEAFR
jgi:cytochrome c556